MDNRRKLVVRAARVSDLNLLVNNNEVINQDFFLPEPSYLESFLLIISKICSKLCFS
jgi:hypothetical protein